LKEDKNNLFIFIYIYIDLYKLYIMGIGDWGLWIGDWGLGIGDWGLGPIPNPQSPIPNKKYILCIWWKILYYNKILFLFY